MNGKRVWGTALVACIVMALIGLFVHAFVGLVMVLVFTLGGFVSAKRLIQANRKKPNVPPGPDAGQLPG